ncbi:MAG: HD domain-containing protein [candidate division KSB1 bacterium]|nr:HD domain-containing protein [candidate division KSB1 bacterium]
MLQNLQPGEELTDFFILRRKELRCSRDSNEQYWALELGSAQGRIFGSLWGDRKAFAAAVSEGDIVKVRAKVIEWKGRPYLDIEQLRKAKDEEGVAYAQLIPRREGVQDLSATLRRRIETMENPHLRLLLQRVLDDARIQGRIEQAPAGKLWHHCRLGGLLEHTLQVLRAVEALAPLYAHVDRELLIAGAVLHDIGKIFEFEWDRFIDYSDEGRLLGHAAIGYHLVADHIREIDGFPEELRKKLLHMILAHHGEREKGAVVPPMTREAILLHYIDEMDAKMSAFARIFEQEGGRSRWSRYVNLLDCFFYFGEPEENQQAEAVS